MTSKRKHLMDKGTKQDTPKEPRYKYNLWLEIERVEIDEQGVEIGDYEDGAMFGHEPAKLMEEEDFNLIKHYEQKIVSLRIDDDLIGEIIARKLIRIMKLPKAGQTRDCIDQYETPFGTCTLQIFRQKMLAFLDRARLEL